VVSGYKVTTDSNGKNTWTLLGKRDPNTPQMFYPIESNVTVKYGDSLVIFVAKFMDKFFKNILICRLLDVQWPVTGTSLHKLGKFLQP
jgi:Copper type II ascorbate-dependent monooxygenase, C-terminal domain